MLRLLVPAEVSADQATLTLPAMTALARDQRSTYGVLLVVELGPVDRHRRGPFFFLFLVLGSVQSS